MHVVRFLKANIKGTKSAEFVGKGDIVFESDKFIINGKKLLPFGVQFLVFVLFIFISWLIGYVTKIYWFAVPNILLAIIVDIFVRTSDQISFDKRSIGRISKKAKKDIFLIVFAMEREKQLHLNLQIKNQVPSLLKYTNN